MKVTLNKSEIIIFKGATVSDLVLAYSVRSHKMLQHGKLRVYDRFGNLTEPDGPVYEGQMFFLKRAE
ncbi:MAG: hypothetical protein WC780_05685 [Lentimicrobiaceae bacterium]|jgi:hypothetical protein